MRFCEQILFTAMAVFMRAYGTAVVKQNDH
jgi:hypothetical protein